MLYPERVVSRLTDTQFQTPGAAYRGTPFWSWNCEVTQDLIDRQLEIFSQMGFGGAHLHARTGLQTPYLSDAFMQLVAYANTKMQEKQMLCWLYDEDRFPSGAAGGLVTRNKKFRARHLVLSTQKPNSSIAENRAAFEAALDTSAAFTGYFVCAYDIVLQNGCLHSAAFTNPAIAAPKGRVWYAFVQLMDESPWYNNQAYLDTLNPLAVQAFLKTTYTRYATFLQQDFGGSVPAIFTDEPHMTAKAVLPFAEASGTVTMSFTDDLPEEYTALWGVDFWEILPHLFWEMPNAFPSVHRYRYHNLLAERFATAYAGQLGAWCEAHGIALTGHFLSERTLFSQTLALGDAMRQYAPFQLPGVDVLCDQKELSTVKQAVSVARQQGREGVLSELYGVTHWDCNFKTYKLQGDWQAALGVTIRVPHLAFMSMEGEAKRDWPASISYQSPWYGAYSFVENHFARLNTALTRGKPIVRIGMVHPIESFWLAFGPNDQTGTKRQRMDEQFEQLHQWLLYDTLDFDWISEALLPQQWREDAQQFCVGEMAYDIIIVPNCTTLRRTTLSCLKSFAVKGGKVVFLGEIPFLCDGLPAEDVRTFASSCSCLPFEKEAVLQALQPVRLVTLQTENGMAYREMFYQMRQDGEVRWLFLCHVNANTANPTQGKILTLTIQGGWQAVLYDTQTGAVKPIAQMAGLKSWSITPQQTVARFTCYTEDSFLLQLTPCAEALCIHPPQASKKTHSLWLKTPQIIHRHEPNVLLLDKARYQLNDEAWQPEEDILRLDNALRKKLGYPLRCDRQAQPWCGEIAADCPHWVTLEYPILADCALPTLFLAMEQGANVQASWNGQPFDLIALPTAESPMPPIFTGETTAFFCDSFIGIYRLPPALLGQNTLRLRIPFGARSNLEAVYVLGEFGVRLCNNSPCLAPLQPLGLGDITRQGLPFYTGNLSYRFSVELPVAGAWQASVPHFKGAAITVAVHDKPCGVLAYAPHRIQLPHLPAGHHTLTFTLQNTRYNTFGTLHNANENYRWYGPDSYRTTAGEWTEEYLIKPVGILSAILLECAALPQEEETP